jgi:hypothetical protein
VLHTLDYSLEQLMRMQDRIDKGMPVRIIHMLNNDTQGWEDHYYVLIDCDPKMYTMLCLL